jgi:CMP-N-acetylneuraminic acid synthetase
MKAQNILTIIPARAGSKRLIGKNNKELKGKPLIAYSIEYAQEQIGGDILVSTDDAQSKEIALSYGVEVMDRPASLAQDVTTTLAVLEDIVNKTSKKYDWVVLLQPTNPLRPAALFEECWTSLQKAKASSLLTVSLNTKKIGEIEEGCFKPLTYAYGQRSQDLKANYYENGLLYIASVEQLKKGVLLNEASMAVVVDHPYATVDIDDQQDWDWAEFLLSREG